VSEINGVDAETAKEKNDENEYDHREPESEMEEARFECA
jgi:hypothetical protein